MRICVRLPNWLGDIMMSLGFLHLLRQLYPTASISVVVKKGLEQTIANLPGINHIHVFSKENHKGLKGVWKFGKELAAVQKIDLFFVLPDSLSAAVMAYGSGAKKRIGYRKEGRSLLLTHAYQKPSGKHRIEEYAALLSYFNPAASGIAPVVHLPLPATPISSSYMVVNINSEAVSRRLPVQKAVALITLLQAYSLPIKLIGSSKELPFVTEVYNNLPVTNNIEIVAGQTNLQQLIILIQQATLMVSSDSGPAHIASASGVPLVVMFGAGNEQNTGPYNNRNAIVVRNGTLPCEPCVKNYCKLAPLPVCMLQLDLLKVKGAVDRLLNITKNESESIQF